MIKNYYIQTKGKLVTISYKELIYGQIYYVANSVLVAHIAHVHNTNSTGIPD